MSNEELAVMIQNGDIKRISELWEQVRRFVWKQARRWVRRAEHTTIEAEDLVQSGFFALLEAVERFEPDRGMKFITFLNWSLKNHFNAAMGRGTKREANDPIHGCLSLNVPLGDDSENDLEYLIADPDGQAGYEEIESSIWLQQLREIMASALGEIPERQKRAIELYFFQNCNLRGVGAALGVSSERARAIRDSGLYALRENADLAAFVRQ